MSRTRSNHERAQWTISLLGIKPHDRILEIGFGPGIAIELASRLAGDGRVVGLDHSEVMLRQATRRNASAVRNGRVELHLGSVAELPRFEEPFDKVFTINSIHFWEEPLERLKELRRVLKPGGMIAVTLQPRSRNATGATHRGDRRRTCRQAPSGRVHERHRRNQANHTTARRLCARRQVAAR